MKAIVSTKYGSPDILELKEVENPVPNDHEVLIKVFATTVNRTDTATLRGKPFLARLVTGMFKPKKPILGSEFAGKVEGVGKSVSSFKIGDNVFGFNEDGFGSHAEYMTISADKALTTIPENISYEQAAASTEGAHYAYNFINKVDLKRGQKVLVNGATGAIGSAAVQLLKYFGANVTAVCNTKNIDLVKSQGADKIIDYMKEDFTKEKQKFNFIFDTVGKSSFAKCLPLLESGGIYISSDLGYMAQNIFLPLITPIIKPMIGNKKTIFPMPTDCIGSVLLVKELIEKARFKAVIDRKYPLEEIVEAYKYVEKGQKTGNVVITIEHNNTA
ncbi:MAG: NAD(P)-dependent alcohol dehydrogenase [Cyclobacteriaceae bacterium]|nr:NAD(P)-dependent alcohol dehydrogenase [Cyclobacteriaceae bacterium]MDH4295465.1 NAD(P)-dependent alcohol dehydrogenase [Cyclobacteriaceae bacterium]MDH5249527.1 NAD(P)-dependent alcohol dehydrogenase [Cyclobacteriaceae bacterium]